MHLWLTLPVDHASRSSMLLRAVSVRVRVAPTGRSCIEVIHAPARGLGEERAGDGSKHVGHAEHNANC